MLLRSLKPLLFLASASLLTPAQTQQPTPPKTQQQPAQSGITLHTGTQLVVVDVVVTDSHQAPVHNLKPSDFTLLEKNTPQQIKSFEEHTSLSAADAAKLEPMPKLPPGIFTNYSPAPLNSAVNVLLLDTLNTPMRDQAFVRDQLHQYLKSASAGTRIAIFGLTTRLNLLQGFTSDPEILKAVISKKTMQSSPLLDDPVGGGPQPDSLSDTLSSFGSDPTMASVVANVQQFEAQTQSFQLQLRAKYTLDAMNQLARYLVGIPGRKNLIWFSGSFPIDILPDGNLNDPFAVMASSEEEFRETTNLLTVSQVAVYPVDARGLMTSPMFNASNSGSKYVKSPTAFAGDNSKFLQQTADEHSTMLRIADETGGRAFINTNGLTQAVAKAIDGGSNYYTLTYSPSNTKWNGDYRKIEVKLQQPGLTLAYRRGYYADDPNAPAKKGAFPVTMPANAPPSLNPMNAAMMRGGPDPTQIIIKVRVLPTTSTPEDKPASGNTLNPARKTKGPFRRYSIDYAADPRAVLFISSPDGTYRGEIEFVTYLYDQDGNLINVAENKTNANLAPAAYQEFLRHGIPWHQEVSVPVKGDYYLRIGIHDLTGDRVGAVEVPIATIKDLPPLTATK
jgi:VWFA-related protein